MLIACFYIPQLGIAVERARLNHLWGVPVGLAGAEDTLLTVSDEAAPFGIKAGQTASGARGLCEKLIVLPYDRQAYDEAANLIWDLFAVESSVVQPASPEVCYVELKDHEAQEVAARLSQQLAANVRVPAYVGVARTKFVGLQAAKLQSFIDHQPSTTGHPNVKSRSLEDDVKCSRDFSHQPYTHPSIISPAHFLSPLPITCASHLPDKVVLNLQRIGVRTFRDLQKIPGSELKRRFGEIGLALEHLAAGEDNDPIKPLWPPPRIEESVAFEDETVDTYTIGEALRRCAEAIASELTARHVYCRSMILTVHQADGSKAQQREKLAMASHTTVALHRAALRLLRRMEIAQPLLGVSLYASDLGAGSGVQLALLDQNRHGRDLPHERQRSMDATTSVLRKKFGVAAIIMAGRMRESKRISLWTYPLGHQQNEVIQVDTDERGKPVRFWRNGQPREVKRIQDSWREAEWFWGGISETTVYRVETEFAGLCELQLIGKRWRLGSTAD